MKETKGANGTSVNNNRGSLCCYGNYKRVFKTGVEVAMSVLARDYKGFGSGLIGSNMIVEMYE